MTTDNERSELIARFPWLGFLQETASSVVNTLFTKERDYQGSWQRRGGIGAFMMLARKWDRIESIARGHSYNVIEAGLENTGGICDDIDDLIGYLMLVRSEVRRRGGGSEPTSVYVSQDPENDARFVHRHSFAEQRTREVVQEIAGGKPVVNIFSDDPEVDTLAPGGIRGVSLE